MRDQVRQPLMYRKPVGYQREFLEAYQPGITFYLHEMGRTSADERPAGTYARDILGRLLVDLSWASSKLEGNTYSRLDTQNLIELGQVAQGKDAIETQMILNHKAAIEMLIEDADEVGFDAFTFKNLHAVLSRADQAAFAEMLATALQQLHEGCIARYRLRRSEYRAWQQVPA